MIWSEAKWPVEGFIQSWKNFMFKHSSSSGHIEPGEGHMHFVTHPEIKGKISRLL